VIRHIVLLDLIPDYDRDALQSIMTGLDGLRGVIAGFDYFAHGPNRDFEAMSPDCAYAFTCDFQDEAVSRAYLADPTHQALGARLVAMCQDGAKGITVIDMDGAA